jgi:hypothetical protein
VVLGGEFATDIPRAWLLKFNDLQISKFPNFLSLRASKRVFTMNCWICGAPALTGEHKSKRSDLRSLFGTPSQRDPIYYHTAQRRNKKVGSLDSSILKSSAKICAKCNNERTQPHDLAWQSFSETVRQEEYQIASRGYVRANHIFPYDTRRAMRFVQLYWVKVFGCAAAEGDIPVDLVSLGQSILLGHAHPNIYLRFGWMHLPVKMAGASDVQTAMLGGVLAFATRFHNVGNLAINLIYAIPGEKRNGLVGAWHPYRGTKTLQFKLFD